MIATFANFSALYDWSLIERAVQAYLVATDAMFVAPPADDTREEWAQAAGDVAVITAFEANIFQQARPRVVIDLNDIAPFQPLKLKEDANGQLRPMLYRANLRLGLVTKADYTAHVALRSYVASLADTFVPLTRGGSGNTGINAHLTVHAASLLVPGGNSTTITPEDGHYVSVLNYQLTFAIRAEAWPAS